MIAAEGLRLQAGAKLLFAELSFAARRGEFIAVLGPNGVGKTTLLRTLAGVRSPMSGTIAVNDRDIRSLDARTRARTVAYIGSDDLFVDYLTVRDVVASGRYAHHRWWEWQETRADCAAIDDAMRQAGAGAFANRLFDTLSSGERQRVWIALALAQEAPVLLLDEPTSHLDVHVAQDVLAVLYDQTRRGKTVVCALHDINEAAQFADRVLVLGHGRALAFDAPDRVLNSSALDEAYGVRLERLRTPSGALRVLPAARLTA